MNCPNHTPANTKKHFRIMATATDYFQVDVVAHDKNEAWNIARDLDPNELELVSGHWEIEDVEELCI